MRLEMLAGDSRWEGQIQIKKKWIFEEGKSLFVPIHDRSRGDTGDRAD